MFECSSAPYTLCTHINYEERLCMHACVSIQMISVDRYLLAVEFKAVSSSEALHYHKFISQAV